ncbi:MAG: amidohydrolase family protein [Ferroplasma sp.]
MAFDIILKDGNIFYGGTVHRTSIGIKDGIISAIGSIEESNTVKLLNLHGKLVIPGGVDPHTHIEGYSSAGTIKNGTAGAAIGGTTTVLDFSQATKDEDTVMAAKSKIKRFSEQSPLDFTIKPMMVTSDFESDEKLENIFSSLQKLGIIAVKLFTTYKNLGRYANNYQIFNAMKAAKKYNIMVQVHAENNDFLEGNMDELLSAGKTDAIYHAESKPDISEDIAVADAAIAAGEAGERAYCVHLSTKNSPEIIDISRKNGIDIYGETCPQYLILDENYLKGENGNEYICSPPLRKKEDIKAMWDAIAQGKISTIGSDHVPFLKEQKKPGIPFNKVPNGVPGIETRLPLIFSEGVQKGRITLQRFVDLVSTEPARIFGLYPRKGVIDVGSDADIAVIDTKLEHGLKAEDLHMGTDIALYGHMKTKGWPVLTIAGGEIVAEDDVFIKPKRKGKFLRQVE